MLANLTLADAQLQIGATLVLLIMAYGLGWLSARAKDWLQRELLEAGIDLPPAQMTPFRGPLGPAIEMEHNPSEPPSYSAFLRAAELEIAHGLGMTGRPSQVVEPSSGCRRCGMACPACGPLVPAIDDLYTEHSPQIPELRKPSGPFGDDWRGGEYGGSVDMLRRGAKEIED